MISLALNIDGMSGATLEFLIEKGWVKCLKDLYNFTSYKEIYNEWISTPGYGKKSVDKLIEAIEASRKTTLERLLYAQSINLIGRSASKDVSKFCNGDIEEFCKIMSAGAAKKFLKIDGFGETMYESLMNWYENHWIEFIALKSEFTFASTVTEAIEGTIDLGGLTFCITGKLIHHSNRDELVASIESHGGKYVGSVSSKTAYLINNDVNSTSGKNAKAKQVGCKVISEEDYLEMIK